MKCHIIQDTTNLDHHTEDHTEDITEDIKYPI